MIVAVGGSVQVQVSSITWVQHVSLTSWTYIYNPGLMIFSPNLASFHSKPLWSVICILAPTGWKLFGWDFFFFSLPHCLLFCIFSLTHSPYLGLVNSYLPPSPLPWLPLSPAPSIPPSPHRRDAQDLLLISAMPQNETNKLADGRSGFQSRLLTWMWSLGWAASTLAVVEVHFTFSTIFALFMYFLIYISCYFILLFYYFSKGNILVCSSPSL